MAASPYIRPILVMLADLRNGIRNQRYSGTDLLNKNPRADRKYELADDGRQEIDTAQPRRNLLDGLEIDGEI